MGYDIVLTLKYACLQSGLCNVFRYTTSIAVIAKMFGLGRVTNKVVHRLHAIIPFNRINESFN